MPICPCHCTRRQLSSEQAPDVRRHQMLGGVGHQARGESMASPTSSILASANPVVVTLPSWPTLTSKRHSHFWIIRRLESPDQIGALSKLSTILFRAGSVQHGGNRFQQNLEIQP